LPRERKGKDADRTYSYLLDCREEEGQEVSGKRKGFKLNGGKRRNVPDARTSLNPQGVHSERKRGEGEKERKNLQFDIQG